MEKSAQNCPKPASFEWTVAKDNAAQFIADGDLTNDAIADKVGVVRRTLYEWRQHPEFRARVAELVERYGDARAKKAIANRLSRLAADNRRWLAMERLIEARAEDMATDPAGCPPGGETGLLVRRLKSIGSGPAAREVEEYEFDAALVKEIRELEKHAAIDLGQWTEKRENVNVDPAELRKRFLAAAGAALRFAQQPGGENPANDDDGAKSTGNDEPGTNGHCNGNGMLPH